MKASRKGPTPKLVSALPKNTGVSSPARKRVVIKRGACAGQQADLFLKRTIGFAELLRQAWMRKGIDLHRRSALIVRRAFKEQYLAFAKVVEPLK